MKKYSHNANLHQSIVAGVNKLADNVASVVQKLNTTYQQQLTDEYEVFTLFIS